jgi:hypothetical protein
MSWGRKKEKKALEQEIVAEWNDLFRGWSDGQRRALAAILVRVLPSVVEGVGSRADMLPLRAIGDAVWSGFKRLGLRLATDTAGTLDRLRSAFYTDAPDIRAYCAAVFLEVEAAVGPKGVEDGKG